MKITRLRIRDYRGISTLDVKVPPAGVVAKGRNGSGKSSVLGAIRAALIADDVDADAIRLGAESSEILVDMDAIKVRRAITKKGGSPVQVENAEGDRWGKPQTRLNELLGTSALDPLEFFLGDDAKKRRLVLEAIPLRVTQEQIDRWCAGAFPDGHEAGGASLETTHGFEVIASLRKRVADMRTKANRAADEAAERVAAQRQHVASLGPVPEGGQTYAEARQAVAAAEVALRDLEARRAASERAAKATESTRARVATLRQQAADTMAKAPAEPDGNVVQAAADRLAVATAELGAARAAFEEAQRVFDAEFSRHLTLRAAIAERKTAEQSAAQFTSQADELASTLSDLDSMTVAEAEFVDAEFAKGMAQRAAVDAEKREQAAIAAAQLAKRVDEAAAADAEAERLDAVVKRLTNDAPAELAKLPEMIAGLTFTDTGTVALDGVSVTKLSSAEQLRFAIDLARRANAKAKILVVDGLERVDPEQFGAFVQHATRDGWQLLATKVEAGDLTVEAIQAES